MNNYIYLKYYNFLYFDKVRNPMALFSEAKNALKLKYANAMKNDTFLQKNTTRQEFTKRYEDNLNKFYTPSQRSDGTVELLSAETSKEVDAIIKQHLDQIMQQDVVITPTGKAGYSQGGKNVLSQIATTAKLITQTNSWFNNINKNVHTLLETYNSLPSDIQKSARLKTKMDKLEAQWKKLQDSFKNAPQLLDNKGRINLSKISQEQADFIDSYNSLVKMFFSSSSYLTGMVGELGLLLRSYLIEHGIDNIASPKQAAQILQQVKMDLFNGKDTNGFVFRAQDRSAKGFTSALFSSKVQDTIPEILSATELTPVLHEANGEYVQLFVTQPTQDKVDVTVRIDGTSLNASVKNYDLSKQNASIHIVGDTNPYVLLEKDASLLCHYLNISSEHGYYTQNQDLDKELRYERQMQQKYPGIDVTQKEPSATLIDEAHETIKVVMLANALAGGQLTSNNTHNQEADILVVNDTSKGKWRIYWVDEIIAKVASNSLLTSITQGKIQKTNSKGQRIEVDGFKKKGSLYSIGNWASMDTGGKARMTNLYKQMAQQHIYISLAINKLDQQNFEY